MQREAGGGGEGRGALLGRRSVAGHGRVVAAAAAAAAVHG